MTTFFVSYTSADKTWAEWIGYVIEEEGFKVTLQAWDFRPGSNFVLEMQRATTQTDRTIVVVSPDYLNSLFASPEWATAFVQDPQGLNHKLVPVLVRHCKLSGLLSSVVHVSLVGEDESSARKSLLDGISSKRSKPSQRPSFPGSPTARASKPFPGPVNFGSHRPVPYVPNVVRIPTEADRRRFSREAFGAIQSYFRVALENLARHRDAVEYDFQPNTATEFTAEVFVDGKSICRCRIWQGGMLSSDSISYAEGHLSQLGTACNEILSASGDRGGLYMTSHMGMAVGHLEKDFDLKRMSQEQAAEYLWRRLVLPLEN